MSKKQKITVQNTKLLQCWHILMTWIYKVAGKGKPNSSWRKVGKLAAWCSHQNIALEQLTTEITFKFYTWLMEDSGLRCTRKLYSTIRKSWADLVEKGKVPQLEFYNPPRKWSRYGIRTRNLPPHHRNAIIDLLERIEDGTDENFSLALGTESRSSIQRRLERFLGFVQNEMGMDLASITFIDLFANQKYIKAFHAFKVKRKGGKVMVGHLDELKSLAWIGERYISYFHQPVDMKWLHIYIKRVRKHAERKEKGTDSLSDSAVLQVIQAIQEELKRAYESGFSNGYIFPIQRDLFTIQHLFDHGNRISDLTTARMGIEIIPKGDEFICNFGTKNQAEDRFTMSIEATKALNDLLRLQCEMGMTSNYLLQTRNGKPLLRQQAHQQIQIKFQNILGVHFHPHAFRHTFFTGELNRHSDPGLASLRMGNKSTQTAQKHYDRLQTAQALDKWHNLILGERNNDVTSLLYWTRTLLQRCETCPQTTAIVAKHLTKYEEDLDENPNTGRLAGGIS